MCNSVIFLLLSWSTVFDASNVGSNHGFVYFMIKNSQVTKSHANDENHYNILQIHKSYQTIALS